MKVIDIIVFMEDLFVLRLCQDLLFEFVKLVDCYNIMFVGLFDCYVLLKIKIVMVRF